MGASLGFCLKNNQMRQCSKTDVPGKLRGWLLPTSLGSAPREMRFLHGACDDRKDVEIERPSHWCNKSHVAGDHVSGPALPDKTCI